MERRLKSAYYDINSDGAYLSSSSGANSLRSTRQSFLLINHGRMLATEGHFLKEMRK